MGGEVDGWEGVDEMGGGGLMSEEVSDDGVLCVGVIIYGMYGMGGISRMDGVDGMGWLGGLYGMGEWKNKKEKFEVSKKFARNLL